MRLLYTIGILFYTLGVRVASLWNKKARQMCVGWREVESREGSDHSFPIAWFHVSSLGEFEQGRPVIAAFRQSHPDYKIVLTFFSPSGYEVRKNCPDADVVCYLPPDTPRNARRLVRLIRPQVVFFVKYDFWYNILGQLRREHIPTYIFSTIFRPGQYFFGWAGGWFRRQLKSCFTHIFVQNAESLQLLQSHGIDNCSIAGDTRFDRVHDIAQEGRRDETVEAFLSCHPAGSHILLAGSSWEPDEEHLARYLQHCPDTLLILAPHVIAESHLKHIEELFGKDNCLRYSQLKNKNENQNENPQPKVGDRQWSQLSTVGDRQWSQLSILPPVLLIDNIGLLATLYRYAHVAYIGGGFGQGIHNTLEAITFGKPVVFGPNYRKFQEARDIIALGGGFTFERYEQLEERLDSLFGNPESLEQASTACRNYMEMNLGSTRTILAKIEIEKRK